jgi:hypothetical protein
MVNTVFQSLGGSGSSDRAPFFFAVDSMLITSNSYCKKTIVSFEYL